MLNTVTELTAPTCRFEILEGDLPKPVEMAVTSPNPILATMIVSPSYRAEGRIGTRTAEFLRLGRSFFHAPDQEMRGRGSGGRTRVARCIFDSGFYRDTLQPADLPTEAQLVSMLDVSSATIDALVRRLIDEAMSPGFASEMLLDSISTTLLIESGRRVFHRPAEEFAGARGGLQPRHLKLVTDYLESLEVGFPRIAELAQLCGFSPHYFTKLFREATGQSLGRYVSEWRMRRAERLLLESDLPLKEIAFRLGFANAANFSTAFTKEYRQTPGRFRKLRTAQRLVLRHSALH